MRKKFSIRSLLTLLITDIAFWAVAIFILITWRVVADKQIITRYLISYAIFASIWVVFGILIKKYKSWRKTSYKTLLLKVLITSILTAGYILYHYYKIYPDLSILTLYFSLLIVLCINIFAILIYQGYRYATFMDVVLPTYEKRHPNTVLEPPITIDKEKAKKLKQLIINNTNKETFDFLSKNTPLESTNTHITQTTHRLNIQLLTNYQYDCIINLSLLNNIIGINKFFCVVNEKLPDNGIWVCSFISQDVLQKNILNKYPKVIRKIVFYWNILCYRVIPKLFFFQRLYYQNKKNKQRYFSHTEILGRLSYCGFEIVKEEVINGITYIISKRKDIPQKQEPKFYGLLIKLPRIGKKGEIFNVYKLRTMYPYAEYIQEYIYQKNSLTEGGKFKNDIRVTSYGQLMRKYWLDELPMIFNLIKGDMKLVGVRPLSRQYFSLYSKELQEKRTTFKPGLLPPFYADMPKTLEEIQESEMKYLKECEVKGVFLTDFKYFWRILVNILFKKVRSK